MTVVWSMCQSDQAHLSRTLSGAGNGRGNREGGRSTALPMGHPRAWRAVVWICHSSPALTSLPDSLPPHYFHFLHSLQPATLRECLGVCLWSVGGCCAGCHLGMNNHSISKLNKTQGGKSLGFLFVSLGERSVELYKPKCLNPSSPSEFDG